MKKNKTKKNKTKKNKTKTGAAIGKVVLVDGRPVAFWAEGDRVMCMALGKPRVARGLMAAGPKYIFCSASGERIEFDNMEELIVAMYGPCTRCQSMPTKLLNREFVRVLSDGAASAHVHTYEYTGPGGSRWTVGWKAPR